MKKQIVLSVTCLSLLVAGCAADNKNSNGAASETASAVQVSASEDISSIQQSESSDSSLSTWSCQGTVSTISSGQDRASNIGHPINIEVSDSDSNRETTILESSFYKVSLNSSFGSVSIVTKLRSGRQIGYSLAGSGARVIHHSVTDGNAFSWAMCSKLAPEQTVLRVARRYSKVLICRGVLHMHGGLDAAPNNGQDIEVLVDSGTQRSEMILLQNSSYKLSLKNLGDAITLVTQSKSTQNILGSASTNIESRSLHFSSTYSGLFSWAACVERQ